MNIIVYTHNNTFANPKTFHIVIQSKLIHLAHQLQKFQDHEILVFYATLAWKKHHKKQREEILIFYVLLEVSSPPWKKQREEMQR